MGPGSVLAAPQGFYLAGNRGQSRPLGRVVVSPYRPGVALDRRFLILAAVVWRPLDWGHGRVSVRLRTVTAGQKRLAFILLGLVFLQSLLGAFVAGNNAGMTYNTWPLMDGSLVPDGLGTLSPWYLNIFENITAVQFNHRVVAYVLAAAALVQLAWLARSADDEKLVRSAQLLVAGIFAQAALGIWTLLAVVPLWLGLAHQAGAAAVLILAVRHTHLLTRAPAVRAAPADGYPATPSIS